MDDSLLNTPEFKIPSIPRRATPKPTFTAAGTAPRPPYSPETSFPHPARPDDSEDDEDDDDDEAGEEEDYVDEVALVAEGHDWSYEENVYSDDGDDADGDVDQEEIFGSSSPHPMSPIAHRGHYSPISYSSSLPSSFPSHYSSPSSSSAASSDTPTSTSHPSSVHSTPPSFSTPPIPNTKTTPFLRLKRDPATNYHHHLNASIVGDANGHTPAGTTPGRSNRPRFHTPPLPSPARTTPFFVSKVRAKERVKTPQAKPLWTRAAEYANGYDDESYGDRPSTPIRRVRRASLTHSLLSLQPTLAVVQTTTRIWRSRNSRTRGNALCFARRRSPPRRAPSPSSHPTPSRPGREASATDRPLEGRWSPTTDA